MVVEHSMDKGPYKATNPNETPNATNCKIGVRLWGISSMVKRETAQIVS